ncbi:transcriptional regulator [Chondrocystis sp. NIES-4102]|nr:transcriptional regulator [Chondrocystis sp. NIES-4102]
MLPLTKERAIKFFQLGDELPKDTNNLWLIEDGVVKTYTISETRTSIILGFWGKGDIIGQSLCDVDPYMIKCMSKVSAIALPQEYWQTLSFQFLDYAKQTQQLMYIVRNHRIAKRLWLLLTWLANKFGRGIEEGKLIDFKITHQELAEAIGTTRITVTKILNQFEKEGLILRPKTKCIVVLM